MRWNILLLSIALGLTADLPGEDGPLSGAEAIGSLGPSFKPAGWAGHTAGGQFVGLDDKHLRGSWIVVEFWRSNGRDRRKDERVMAGLRQKYLSDDRVKLVSVCVDLETDEWMDNVSRHDSLKGRDGETIRFHSDAKWTQLLLVTNDEAELKSVVSAYGLKDSPVYVLIQPDGCKAWKSPEAAKLTSQLADVLKGGH